MIKDCNLFWKWLVPSGVCDVTHSLESLRGHSFFLPPTCCLLLTSQGSQEPFWIYSLCLKSEGDEETQRRPGSSDFDWKIARAICYSLDLFGQALAYMACLLQSQSGWQNAGRPAGKGLSDLSALEKEVFSLACRIHLLPLRVPRWLYQLLVEFWRPVAVRFIHWPPIYWVVCLRVIILLKKMMYL